MASNREKELANEMLAAALADGMEFTPELVAYISSEARSQAAVEREAKEMEAERRAVLTFGYPVHRCTKCAGSGFLERYAGIASGRCFTCHGKGWVKA